MIIRRFVTALRQQDWATVTIEFFLVVAGIFLGLQASEWADKVESEKREIEYYEALLSDFEKSSQDLQTAITFKKNQISDLQELLTRGQSALSVSRRGEILYRGVYSTGSFVPTLTSLRDLEASGNLGLISDPVIRRGLSKLSASLDRTEGSLNEYLFFHQNDLDPFIARNLPVVGFLSKVSGAEIPVEGKQDWSVLDSALARGLLVFKMSLAANYIGSLTVLDHEFQTLITEIDNKLRSH